MKWFMILVLVGWATCSQAREERLIEDFTIGWKSGNGLALGRGHDGQLAFPCPMSRGKDRYYFDKKVSLDLSRETSIELKLACNDPGAVRLVALYLESGSGWYLLNAPLIRPGRSSLLFSKATAAIEGKPAGWQSIKRIRLSIWKGASRDTEIFPASLRGYRDQVFVIQPTSSTPKSDQKWLGKSAFQRMNAWLNAAGISHGILTDDEVKKGKLKGGGVAILPYNPVLDWAQRKYLKEFVEGGGRLIVCRGEHPQFAEFMGVRVGRFMSSGEFGKFNAVRFHGDGFPAIIHDHNWEVVTAEPAGRTTRVVGEWMHANGRPIGMPAVMSSPAGYWFTQVLRSGDRAAKQRMLLQMIGETRPEVWHQALSRLLENPLEIPVPVNGYEGVAHYLKAEAARAKNPAVYKAVLNHTDVLYRQMKTAWEANQFGKSFDLASTLRSQLLKCYAMVQQPRAAELRGVWDHNGTGLYAGGWEATCQHLSENGINAVFPNMMWSYKAHYPSEILPRSKTLDQFGDQVAQCLKAAKKRGIEVHLWKVCWQVSAGSRMYNEFLNNGRLQQNASGQTTNWLNPAHPVNRQYEIEAMKEAIRKYDIDGMHLDYIRYPDRNSCYSPYTRRAFERFLGAKVSNWPSDAFSTGRYGRKFEAFRAKQINDFVAEAYRVLKKEKPSIKVSAAVWGSYPDCIASRGQDWAQWLKADTIDFVTPMNYTESPFQYESWVRNQMRLPGAMGKIYPGIGVISNEAELRADQTIRQINIGRDLGAKGYMLFKLDGPLAYKTLPLLRAGVNR